MNAILNRVLGGYGVYVMLHVVFVLTITANGSLNDLSRNYIGNKLSLLDPSYCCLDSEGD